MNIYVVTMAVLLYIMDLAPCLNNFLANGENTHKNNEKTVLAAFVYHFMQF